MRSSHNGGGFSFKYCLVGADYVACYSGGNASQFIFKFLRCVGRNFKEPFRKAGFHSLCQEHQFYAVGIDNLSHLRTGKVGVLYIVLAAGLLIDFKHLLYFYNVLSGRLESHFGCIGSLFVGFTEI